MAWHSRRASLGRCDRADGAVEFPIQRARVQRGLALGLLGQAERIAAFEDGCVVNEGWEDEEGASS